MDNPLDQAPLPSLGAPPALAPAGEEQGERFTLSPEEVPNIEELVIEDGQPVDTIFAEKQERLLTEPLYSSWPCEGRPFLAMANVGLFVKKAQPALVPDVMLSLDIEPAADLSRKENRTYILWLRDKPPDVVIEFVSDRTGGEDSNKMRDYAWAGVPYYVILDPKNKLGGGVLRAFEARGGKYEPIDPSWLPNVKLGLTMWQGTFEGHAWQWLRWCDQQRQVILTGRERADETQQELEKERKRAERLAERLRSLGIDPDA